MVALASSCAMAVRAAPAAAPLAPPAASEINTDTARSALDIAPMLPLSGMHCLRHVNGVPQPGFPRQAVRNGIQGRLVVQLRFDGADRAPRVDVFHRERTFILREAVLAFAEGLRWHCPQPPPNPVDITYSYGFIGEAPPAFRQVTLAQLLALARDKTEAKRPFDTTGVRCPLAVHWTYRQPLLPNRVTIIGPTEPGHAALIDRLAALELALTRNAADAVWGAQSEFEIPCGGPAVAVQERP
jgi:hypothetical protein